MKKIAPANWLGIFVLFLKRLTTKDNSKPIIINTGDGNVTYINGDNNKAPPDISNNEDQAIKNGKLTT